jgi:hypothetical protein
MQKLIALYGYLNSGKTLLYNLFKKEDNFICLDISPDHFDIYKHQMIKAIGENNTKRLEPLIKSLDIFNPYIFLEEIGLLMKDFPECNFVVKPGGVVWPVSIYTARDKVHNNIKKFTPIKSVNDLHMLFVVRNPIMAWLTTPPINRDIDWFLSFYYKNYIFKHYEIIKIEDLKYNKLVRGLIKKTNLDELLSYSNFDLQMKLKIDYSNIDKDIELIKKKLERIMKFFEYNKDDKNIELFLNDKLSEEAEKIDWGKE